MESSKIVVFKENNEEYAVHVEQVISIEKPSQITPIPYLPNYVKGLVKVRGELVPIIDIHQILYKTELQISENTRFIVIQTDLLQIAFLVEEAKELLEIESSTINKLDLLAMLNTSYFSGVVNLEGRLITLIDPNELIKKLDGINEIYDYMMERKKQLHDS